MQGWTRHWDDEYRSYYMVHPIFGSRWEVEFLQPPSASLPAYTQALDPARFDPSLPIGNATASGDPINSSKNAPFLYAPPPAQPQLQQDASLMQFNPALYQNLPFHPQQQFVFVPAAQFGAQGYANPPFESPISSTEGLYETDPLQRELADYRYAHQIHNQQLNEKSAEAFNSSYPAANRSNNNNSPDSSITPLIPHAARAAESSGWRTAGAMGDAARRRSAGGYKQKLRVGPSGSQESRENLLDNKRGGPRSSERKFCCCFRTKRGCCITVTAVIVVILAGIGTALFFLWPRVPTVTISQPFLNPSANSTYILTGSTTAPTAANPLIVKIFLATNVTVYSPNYEPLATKSITFAGNLLGTDDATAIQDARVDGVVDGVVFPGMGTNAFTMPATVVYTATSAANITTDGALLLVASRCAGTNGYIYMQYVVTIDLVLISWTGYRPSISGTTKFMCPDLGIVV
ncbi:hypothetical protein HDU82_002633 [Entophlyctis luteolus]|nr:hypothetical protein HDU82_002633 [Entophlyctis luteolus]